MTFLTTRPTSKTITLTNLMTLLELWNYAPASYVSTITESSIENFYRTHVSLVHVAIAKLELHLFSKSLISHHLSVFVNEKFGDNLFKGSKLLQSSNALNNPFVRSWQSI